VTSGAAGHHSDPPWEKVRGLPSVPEPADLVSVIKRSGRHAEHAIPRPPRTGSFSYRYRYRTSRSYYTDRELQRQGREIACGASSLDIW
jgi:hypothetical protein